MSTSEIQSILDRLNEALDGSRERALERHAITNQPIVYRDDKNRLVEEYPDGKIIVVKDYSKEN